jgi:hypothetical protein
MRSWDAADGHVPVSGVYTCSRASLTPFFGSDYNPGLCQWSESLAELGRADRVKAGDVTCPMPKEVDRAT